MAGDHSVVPPCRSLCPRLRLGADWAGRRGARTPRDGRLQGLFRRRPRMSSETLAARTEHRHPLGPVVLQDSGRFII